MPLATCARRDGARSLLLVTLDTTRADRVAAFGGAPGVTPRLDALAREGAVFEEAYAPIPETLPSHASILTGLEPPGHGVRGNGRPLPEGVGTLAERLRAAGFATGAFVGSAALDPSFGLARGFDAYDPDFLRGGSVDWAERRAADVNAAALRWIATVEPRRRFLLWAHYFDPHAPYDPPAGFAPTDAARAYDGEVAYADACLGSLLDALRGAGRLEGTIVCVVADHGEGLGDHGEPFHSILLHEPTVHVPLVLWGAPSIRAARVRGPVRLVDLAPTFLELLGLGGATAGAFHGESLVRALASGEAPERAVYLEANHGATAYGWSRLRGLRTADWKFVRAPRPELYRIREDPREARDLASERPDVVQAFDRQLADLESRLGEGARTAVEDPNAASALAALGYAGSGGNPAADSPRDPKDFVGEIATFYRAAELARAGRWREAAGMLEPIAARDPENPEAAILLGEYMHAAGERTAAEAWLARALELKPGHAKSGTLHAILAAERGDLDAAEARFREALRWNPDYADAKQNLAALFARRGRPAEAERLLREVVAKRPGSFEAWKRLGAILGVDAARRADALDALERALALRPDAVDVRGMVQALRAAR